MLILGINAYHGDSSACLLEDGKILCAIEEERITRIKHWAGLPIESIKWCLEYSNKDLGDVDYISISRNPTARIYKKLLRLIQKRPGLSFIKDRFSNLKKVKDLKTQICDHLRVSSDSVKAKFVNVEHHRAHLASSYFASGMNSSACISVDGFGDFVSVMRAKGNENEISIFDTVDYPHSLGIFYTALTQFLGFNNYGDEYKVMGLSAYGKPNYTTELGQIVKLKNNGLFELDNSFFLHDSEGVEMTWNEGIPEIGKLYSDKLTDLLGEQRNKDEEINNKHKDLAASVQSVYEKTFFHMLNSLYEKTKTKNICLAGGCIQNSLANGKILKNTEFKNIYIPPSAHDGGTSVGAALWTWKKYSTHESKDNNLSPYLGPNYKIEEIVNIVEENSLNYEILQESELTKSVAQHLSEGKIVGWFKGGSEWGPRALGNRSILCDPSYPNMKEIINSKIKRRESFRPFAPSVLIEYVDEWFELNHPVPYMEMVFHIKEEKRDLIPAVTHTDGTGRLQTVSKELNNKYYDLIKEFNNIKGIPMVLNTSFNENEPIVNTPQQAIDCYLRTDMDILILENCIIKRTPIQ
ncbi:MAG: carbamoyltransferase family protein [Thermodesulfobacteriota bacterium]